MCVGKNTAVCCLTARKSPRNSSLPLGLAIHILRKMPTKSDDSSVECYGHQAMVSNSCTAPRGIEHYGNWVCRPTTSLRERYEHTHEVGEMSANNADRLAQWDTRVTLRNREPFNTSTIKSQQPAQFYRIAVHHAEPFNRLTYSYRPPHCLWAIASLHLRLSLF